MKHSIFFPAFLLMMILSITITAQTDSITMKIDGVERLVLDADQLTINRGILATGGLDTATVKGPGYRLMWIPNQSAFRVGRVQGQEWNKENVGFLSSVVGGDSNTASDLSSFVGGGEANFASATRSFVGGGIFNGAHGVNSFIGGGIENSASKQNSFIGGGANNFATGDHSFVGGGKSLLAKSYSETVFGIYNLDYTPASTTSWSSQDRLFVIGNGTSTTRSNALTVLKNGNIGIGEDVPEKLLHIYADENPTIKLQSDENNEISGRISIRQFNESGMDMYYDGAADEMVFESFTEGNSIGKFFSIDQNAARVSIGRSTSGSTYPLAIEAVGNGHLVQFFNNTPAAEWQLRLQGDGAEDLGFTESGVADNRFVLQKGGNIGIGIAIPAPSAILDIESSNKGILIPRIDTNEVMDPAQGLMIFQPSSNRFMFYNGSAWESIGGKVIDSDGDTRIEAVDAPMNDEIKFYLNGLEKFRFSRNPAGDPLVEPLNNPTSSIFFGRFSGANSTGDSNIAFGNSSLKFNTTGANNSVVGTNALSINQSGSSNTAFGSESLLAHTSGDENVAIGMKVLAQNETGHRNLAIGSHSGFTNNGSDNVFIGRESGYNEAGSNKLYIENSNADKENALIYGEFDNNYLQVNGDTKIGKNMGIGTNPGAYPLIIKSDNNGDILQVKDFVNDEAKWHLKLVDGGINFVESGVAEDRFHIAPGGNIGINTESDPNTKLFIKAENLAEEFLLRCATPTGGLLELNNLGNLSIAGSYYSASDKRLKKNIRKINNPLAGLAQLSGYNYHWKDEHKSQELQLGLIAQEVQKVFPELVTTSRDGNLGVAYSGLIPVLIEGVNDQQKQINELKAIVEKQQKQIQALLSAVTKVKNN